MPATTLLLGRLKRGSASALGGLVARFFDGQVPRARRCLGRGYRGVDDPEDVVLSAFRRLFADAQRPGEFRDRLQDTDSFLAALNLLIRQRSAKARRDASAQRRDQGRTVREGDVTVEAGALLDGLAGRCADEVGYRELTGTLLDVLVEPDQRLVAGMLIAGHTEGEIAARLGCVVRTVQRLKSIVAGRWSEDPRLAPWRDPTSG